MKQNQPGSSNNCSSIGIIDSITCAKTQAVPLQPNKGKERVPVLRPLTIPSINPFIKSATQPKAINSTRRKIGVIQLEQKPKSSSATPSLTTRASRVNLNLNPNVMHGPVHSTSANSPPDDDLESTTKFVEDEELSVCGICKLTEGMAGVGCIYCDDCDQWYHGTCVNLTNEQINKLAHPNKKSFCVT
ncbi:unnamed protein product, partial [Orchesella dallaii]